MPCDYRRYQADWKAIRARILERAKNKCEWCGVHNHAIGCRDEDGEFYDDEDWRMQRAFRNGANVIKIVLTVAHLDHDLSHNDDDNLRALCQRCHLRYDAEHHARNAAETRDRKRGQLRMEAM